MNWRPSGALKEYLDVGKRETRVLGPVERMLKAAPPDDRDYTVLHPSEMATEEWCLRASCFLLSGEPRTPERHSLRLRNIFEEGHEIHRKWQGHLERGGWLHGAWRCRDCEAVFWATSPSECPDCGAARPKYREVPLHNGALRIKGHADGWIKGLGEDILLEVKSIGPGTIRKDAPHLFDGGNDVTLAWRNIRNPFRPHLKQAKLYLELGNMMVDDGILESFPQEAVFIYELKLDQSMMEFVVSRDPESVQPILDRARDVVAAVAAGESLPCNVDPSGRCKKCKEFG